MGPWQVYKNSDEDEDEVGVGGSSSIVIVAGTDGGEVQGQGASGRVTAGVMGWSGEPAAS